MERDEESAETNEVEFMAASKATAEAVLKEESAEERDTDVESGETKEVDLTAVAKATAETEAVLKEHFAEERYTDEESGETTEVYVQKQFSKKICRGIRHR